MSDTHPYTSDGAPIPSGIPIRQEEQHSRQFGLIRGWVQKAVYPTDPENQTGFFEYIVMIGGQDYFGVMDMSQGGGILNTHTRVRRGVTNVDYPNVFENYDERKDGEAVWCLFIGGDGDLPIIVGSDFHQRAVTDNPDWIAPTKDLGVYERYEFNGLEWLTDKDGNFSLTHLGAKSFAPISPKPFPNPALLPYKGGFYKILNDGTISIDLKLSTTVLINPVTNIVDIQNGAGTKFTIDGSLDEITVLTATGMKYKMTSTADKFEFVTVGGAKVEVDGITDKINILAAFGDKLNVSAADGIQASTPSGTSLSMKSGVVDIDGTGGLIKLGGAQVGIGTSAVELLAKISELLQAIIDYAGTTGAPTHTHTGNLGYFTGPVDIPAPWVAFAASAALIKGEIDSISGGV